MKKLYLLLAISYLVQSCFSYRHIEPNDPSQMVIGQKYKIVRNNKTHKVILSSITENSITVTKYGKEEEIPISEIKSMKERNFSLIKTAAWVPITVAAVALVFAITYSGPNVGAGFTFPN